MATTIFQCTPKEFRLPTLCHLVLEDAYDKVNLLGYPVSLSPFAMLKTQFRGKILEPEMVGNIRKIMGWSDI